MLLFNLRARLWLMALLALLATPVAAADRLQGRPIVIGTSYVVPSRVLGGTRRINVLLPEHYSDPGRRFPVLFLLDGGEHEDFIHIAGIARITAAYGAGQEIIVVGIEGVDRRHDLTSPSAVAADRRRAPTAGGAAQYRRFLVDELKPWVSSHFRASGRSALIGESLGGLFVLETFLSEPSAFSDYVAVSPSLWWNGGYAAAHMEASLRGNRFSDQRFWVAFDVPAPPADVAARERAEQDRVEAALAAVRPEGLSWHVVRSPDGHSQIYHGAAYEAIRTLFAAPAEASPKPGGPGGSG